ncbi:peptidoglycan-binding protein LysM [Flavobacterium branchiophilum NBRC 15030 = ATCC 35035]|nr:peptidoglycan-binding protein LysM [Flavobacterium branchiophilum NBRC 15030 = ATCC 35035]
MTGFEEIKFMLKKWIFYSSLLLIIGFISLSFKPFNLNEHALCQDNQDVVFDYMFPSPEPKSYVPSTVPYKGKFFIGFKEAIGLKESQGQYHLINTLGYMGKYQFGIHTLKTIGIHDSTLFMNSPKLQEKAFDALIKRNKWELRSEIQKYSGKIISGVKITESGILAAAHLGGAGSVKQFLKSNGSRKCKDQYGTSIKHYMKSFGGYDTKGIVADRNARVK